MIFLFDRTFLSVVPLSIVPLYVVPFWSEQVPYMSSLFGRNKFLICRSFLVGTSSLSVVPLSSFL